jgi:hypothetical protein
MEDKTEDKGGGGNVGVAGVPEVSGEGEVEGLALLEKYTISQVRPLSVRQLRQNATMKCATGTNPCLSSW